MHGAPQCACAFAMNNSYLQDVLTSALLQIIRDQVFDVRWMKGVQVKGTVDGDMNRHGGEGIRCKENMEVILL